MRSAILLMVLAMFTMSCSAPSSGPAFTAGSSPAPSAETTRLVQMAARFAPVDLGADVAALPEHERKALGKIVEAARIMDALFLRQAWAGNESMLLTLLQDQSPEGKARLHYFLINKGPWSRLDYFEGFVPGAPKRPDEANFEDHVCKEATFDLDTPTGRESVAMRNAMSVSLRRMWFPPADQGARERERGH